MELEKLFASHRPMACGPILVGAKLFRHALVYHARSKKQIENIKLTPHRIAQVER